MSGRGDDSDAESEDELEWLLGFVEEPESPAQLLRHRFPCKVGGRPAWLDPKHLPTPGQLVCKATGKQLMFLMQVYAPPEGDNPEAFHRTVYVFVSPQGDKLTAPGAVRALRCQLPRKNDFYSFDPPTDADVAPPRLTGADAALALTADPWQVAVAEAAIAAGRTPGAPASGVALLPESELVVEEEELETEEEGKQFERLLQDYNARVASEGELSEEELPAEVLDQVEDNMTLERRHFAMFQARVACAPEQVVRYCFKDGARPLWPNPTGLPSLAEVPPCSRCGAHRRFEFQVMPQLLNHLNLNDADPAALDWGTIAVYTCSASCATAPAAAGGAAGQRQSAYAEEYVWVQGG